MAAQDRNRSRTPSPDGAAGSRPQAFQRWKREPDGASRPQRQQSAAIKWTDLAAYHTNSIKPMDGRQKPFCGENEVD